MSMHPEIAMFWDATRETVDVILACMDGFSGDDLNWQPTPDASSLYVLAAHTMGNVEHIVLRLLGGGPGERDRVAEFTASGDSVEPLQAHWRDLQARAEATLAALPADALDASYEFGSHGAISGRKLLLIMARHAREHMGHAELTRDLRQASAGH